MTTINRLPKEVMTILESVDDTKNLYQESIRMKEELDQIGWYLDFDLAGEIYILKNKNT